MSARALRRACASASPAGGGGVRTMAPGGALIVRWFRSSFSPLIPCSTIIVMSPNGLIDSVRSIAGGTRSGDWTSLAVVSRGEYEAPEGLQFGFPVSSDGRGWKVVEGLQLDDFAREKIRVTTEELIQERDLVKELIPA